jgi:hypothetical protein
MDILSRTQKLPKDLQNRIFRFSETPTARMIKEYGQNDGELFISDARDAEYTINRFNESAERLIEQIGRLIEENENNEMMLARANVRGYSDLIYINNILLNPENRERLINAILTEQKTNIRFPFTRLSPTPFLNITTQQNWLTYCFIMVTSLLNQVTANNFVDENLSRIFRSSYGIVIRQLLSVLRDAIDEELQQQGGKKKKRYTRRSRRVRKNKKSRKSRRHRK